MRRRATQLLLEYEDLAAALGAASALKMSTRLIKAILRRWGYEFVHSSDNPILQELLGAYRKLRLMPDDSLGWADTLCVPAAHSAIHRLIRLHAIDLVLDVGANHGQFAQLVRRLGYDGEMISFEPLGLCCDHLRELMRSDPNWRLVPFALGDRTADSILHVFADDSFSSLHAVNDMARHRFGKLVSEDRTESVSVRRLDDLWPELSIDRPRRVLLKTDTQGHDLAVLQGAGNVLHQTHAVITEAALDPLYDEAACFPDLAAWLTERGFAVSGLFPIAHHPADLALIEMDCAFTRRQPRGAAPSA